MKNILIIGGGNMGLTYALSIQQKIDNASVSILENNLDKIQQLKTATNLTVFQNASECIPNADAILLAVKPQTATILFDSIKRLMKPSQIVISIMAGMKIETIHKGLGIEKIVRAMPNLPSQINEGMTGYIAVDAITKEEVLLTESILGATGAIVKVIDETAIDAVTSLSGSGPAYVFYFMEAMIQQAMEYGFSYKDAKSIVVHTFTGTANLFNKSEDNAKTWIDRVTSKGGTTHAAMETFKKNNVAAQIKECVAAAFNRAQELGKQ